MPHRSVRWPIVGLFIGMALNLPAQDTRSTILGRVTDPGGAIIVGAQVESRNTDTGVSVTAATNASGDFLFPFLIPGPYTVTVEAPGFKRWTRSQIQARVND